MRSVRNGEFKDAPWYLILTRPNQGHIASRQLKRAGFDVFMPRHKAVRHWRGRQIEEMRPVFGSYLFLGTNPNKPRWNEIAKTHGVNRVIGFGASGPCPVPSAIVTGLMLRCDVDGCLRPETELKVGEQVRITCGPFADFVSTIDSIELDRRVFVMLELLGRQTRLKVDCASLARHS
ncbi:transcription termination/antitermination protein NusG [Oceaniovalibus sp. ACAM 378]|uniref:transcription termination/antitermination protein NusG n=1 Tax=Oceaniovalibus sp. ACAM 378 TaxID=2599923 RepID=UPI0011DBE1A8|nr:transcription termination/antitermination NusG family protein [Oceaniovalibus sp. ACAM 378]TYB85615.1 transcriptional activator RfaH [Oceaniovalibus sp. ACAM 378]